jgi:hypothetical protein
MVSKEAADFVRLEKLFLKKGDYQIESWFEGRDGMTGPYYLEISKSK